MQAENQGSEEFSDDFSTCHDGKNAAVTAVCLCWNHLRLIRKEWELNSKKKEEENRKFQMILHYLICSWSPLITDLANLRQSGRWCSAPMVQVLGSIDSEFLILMLDRMYRIWWSKTQGSTSINFPLLWLLPFIALWHCDIATHDHVMVIGAIHKWQLPYKIHLCVRC